MRLQVLLFAFITLLVPRSFAQIQLSAFVVNSGCDTTPLDPNLPIDVGSAALGGSVTIFGTPQVASLCMLNAGPTPVTITNVETTDPDFSNLSMPVPFVLPPNKGNFFLPGVNFTPIAVGTRTGQLTVTDDAANSPQIFQLVGTGFSDFGISLANPIAGTETNLAGQNSVYHLLLLRAPGFQQDINISCGGLPLGVICQPSPNLFPGGVAGIPLGGSSPDGLSVEVVTTGPRVAMFVQPQRSWFLLALIAGTVLICAQPKKRKLLLLASILVISCMIASCGGGSRGLSPTPPGTYTFNITATANGISHSRTLTLIVK